MPSPPILAKRIQKRKRRFKNSWRDLPYSSKTMANGPIPPSALPWTVPAPMSASPITDPAFNSSVNVAAASLPQIRKQGRPPARKWGLYQAMRVPGQRRICPHVPAKCTRSAWYSMGLHKSLQQAAENHNAPSTTSWAMSQPTAKTSPPMNPSGTRTSIPASTSNSPANAPASNTTSMSHPAPIPAKSGSDTKASRDCLSAKTAHSKSTSPTTGTP